jgi:phage gpG-like protein
MNDEETVIEIKGLDQLIKAMKKSPQLKVGILGGGRNAEVGAVHEFGAPARNIPQRSFLRIPLSDHLAGELERSGLLDPETLKEVIKSGTMIPWMKQIGIAAEGVIDDAFENQGPGWHPWSPGYSNEGGSILTDTGQLRQSITSEIQE